VNAHETVARARYREKNIKTEEIGVAPLSVLRARWAILCDAPAMRDCCFWGWCHCHALWDCSWKFINELEWLCEEKNWLPKAGEVVAQRKK